MAGMAMGATQAEAPLAARGRGGGEVGGVWAGGPEPCAPVLSPSGSVCDFRPHSLAPPRSVRASARGDCLFSRGSGTRMLVRPTSPVPVRQQVPVSRPATGEASRNAPDPGVSPRAVPLDRPLSLLRCLDPQPLSCDGDGERFARPRGEAGKSGRQAGGVLKGRANFRSAIISEGIGSAFLPPRGRGTALAVEGARGGRFA